MPTAIDSSLPVPGAIRVGIVEDDAPFRVYLESFFAASPRHVLVGSVGGVEQAQAWPDSVAPHVVLVDMMLGDGEGPAVVQSLRSRFPAVLCVMLTAMAEPDRILAAVQAGAVGYLLKGAAMETVMAAIDDALAGGAPMSPAIARRVLGLMQQTPPSAAPTVATSSRELAALTPREIDVLALVAEGASDKEVADRLQLSSSTVKNLLMGVYGKWRVRSRTHAAVKFVRMKSRSGHGR